LRHKSSHTTARYLHELRGVQISLDEVFGKKKAGKVLDFKKEKVPTFFPTWTPLKGVGAS